MKKHLKSMQGFTLVELLVVISIIGILTTVTMVNYASSQQRARDTQRKNDFKIIRDALEAYKLDTAGQNYPIATAGSGTSTANFTTMGAAMATYNHLKSPYPKDPKDTGSGIFQYRYRSDGLTYTLDTCFENRNDPSKATSVTTPCTANNPNYQVVNP
jgi:type IV pilus assembly protein PilE